MFVTIHFRIFYFPVSWLRISGLQYVKLSFLWVGNLVCYYNGETWVLGV
jgi:hypothetical protein